MLPVAAPRVPTVPRLPFRARTPHGRGRRAERRESSRSAPAAAHGRPGIEPIIVEQLVNDSLQIEEFHSHTSLQAAFVDRRFVPYQRIMAVSFQETASSPPAPNDSFADAVRPSHFDRNPLSLP